MLSSPFVGDRSVSTAPRLRSATASLLVAALLVLAATADAQIPPGYYDTVDTSNSATLRATLHDVIDDHTSFPYTSGGTDTWDILEEAMEDPADPGAILDVYKNDSHPKQGGGNSLYNREHPWPKSYGFPNEGSTNYPHNDTHVLMLCDPGYNTARSNKPYRNCNAGCNEYPTVANNGQGGGSLIYPGNSNWSSGAFTQGTWETWGGRRGDVARALLYLDVRYEGDTHGITLVDEPDLILTDIEALIDASNTGSNEQIAYMGMLSVLLQWHEDDPVDDWERDRNDVVAGYQGNRNPFIDHPEWAACIFEAACGGGGDMTPPAPPTGLLATPGPFLVDLDWNDNLEPDLAGYSVTRATSPGGPYFAAHAGLLGSSDFQDAGLTAGQTYHYVVTASDTSGNESGPSSEVPATPTGGNPGPGGGPWINEFHYNNDGADVGEFVEIAGPAGTDLSGWTITLYNGNGSAVYDSFGLAGTLPDQQACHGTLDFFHAPIQNGAPDGIALVDPGNVVVEFLSYQGSFTAVDGPAQGMPSTNVGVSESGSTPVGHSLQRGGTGTGPADFQWLAAQPNTAGLPNTGQSFGTGGAFADCNGNGTDDACDILAGTSLDADEDGVPDECQSPWTDLGFAKTGSAGDPALSGLGTMASTSPIFLSLSDALASAPAVLFASFTSTPVPLQGGTLVPFPAAATIVLATDAGGGFALAGQLPGGLPPGFELYLQVWISDAGGVQGSAASNGELGTTP